MFSPLLQAVGRFVCDVVVDARPERLLVRPSPARTQQSAGSVPEVGKQKVERLTPRPQQLEHGEQETLTQRE